jgi:hypothetical protein
MQSREKASLGKVSVHGADANRYVSKYKRLNPVTPRANHSRERTGIRHRSPSATQGEIFVAEHCILQSMRPILSIELDAADFAVSEPVPAFR